MRMVDVRRPDVPGLKKDSPGAFENPVWNGRDARIGGKHMAPTFEALWDEAAARLSAKGVAPPPLPPAPSQPVIPPDPALLPTLMDETLLRPEATPEEMDAFLRASRDFPFATVCVHGAFVSRARDVLSGTKTGVAAVVGFPHGASDARAKASEGRLAAADGASEIDMVGPIGLLRGGDFVRYLDHVEAVREAAPGLTLKVILETAALTPLEIVEGSMLSVLGRADFVKTSTGFGPGGATVEAVALMRHTVGSGVGVKAAGGIRDITTLLAMVAAGASRIGTSRGHAICEGLETGRRP